MEITLAALLPIVKKVFPKARIIDNDPLLLVHKTKGNILAIAGTVEQMKPDEAFEVFDVVTINADGVVYRHFPVSADKLVTFIGMYLGLVVQL